ncbi:hypothetical protein J2Z79_002384 [Symbiobacterium terraclitae]|uniref:Uncharacterized protein n=1 Tax=Symbiobacterium terraclitae TaxID=557451 RepID=A0ABS4JTX4_9FIRM|nr:hypothetical protein [Symbiobacterium terraclitae]MBP2018968.1 hypothetical protein [Symbiobacterium terraclitae]
MKTTRRGSILTLLTGALAALALVAARKGFPGAQAAARRLARPGLPDAKVEMYGYREVNVS